MTYTAGVFKYNGDNGDLTGPKDYMASDNYKRRKQAILKGKCPVVNRSPLDTPLAEAIVKSFQTDYANWQSGR